MIPEQAHPLLLQGQTYSLPPPDPSPHGKASGVGVCVCVYMRADIHLFFQALSEPLQVKSGIYRYLSSPGESNVQPEVQNIALYKK